MAGFLSSRVHSLLTGLVILSTVALVGCGSGAKGTLVEGKVTVDGQPANSGTVTLAIAGQTFNGEIQPDGTYKVPGLPAGTAQVGVMGPMNPGGALTPDLAPKTGGPSPTKTVDKPVPIPEKYAKPEASGLPPVQVKGGTTTHNIALSK